MMLSQARKNLPRLFGPGFYPPIWIGNLDNASYQGCPQVRIGPSERLYLCAGTSSTFAILDPFGNAGQPLELGKVTDAVLAGCIGVCFDATLQYAFLACETRAAVSVCDISNPAAPALVEELRMTTELAGATRVERLGNILFVSTFTRRSVALIDCTDPLNLVFLGEYRGPTPGTSMQGCRSVLPIPGTTTGLFVCETQAANVIAVGSFDYTNPALPTDGFAILHSASRAYCSPKGLVLDPDYPTRPYLYVAGSVGTTPPATGGLTILDLSSATPTTVFDSTPFQPRRSAFFSLAGSRGLDVVKLAGKTHLIQTAETIGNMTCWDVTMPTQQGVFIDGFTWGPAARISMDGAMDPSIWFSTVYKAWFVAVACFGSSSGATNTRGLAVLRLSFPGSG